MSLPCSSQDCFMCQLENKEIIETFRVDTKREQINKKNKSANSRMLFVINVAIFIIFLLLVFSLYSSKNEK